MHNLKKISLYLLLSVSFFMTANSEVYDKTLDKVVVIYSDEYIGSGVFISKRGFILTNWHVVKDKNEFYVFTLADGGFEENKRKAQVIKFNETSDLALLKLKTVPKNLDPIKISKVIPRVGDSVHAVGHPHGETWSYAKGYISAHREEYSWVNEQTQFQGDVYQMQTPINPGNSGGPLVNDFGNLIGLNTFGSTEGQGLSYALTVKEIVRFLKE